MKKFIVLLIVLCLTGCQNNKAITRSNLALDTIVSITLYKNGSNELMDECYQIINDYNSKLDAFSEDSLISKINQSPIKVDSDIYSLLEENLKYYQETEGLFSPVLGSLISLWNINEPEIREPPTPDQVNQALEHTDINNLVLTDETVALLDNQEKINLGASTKGFIADRLKDYLLKNGVDSALINLGGNILLVGAKNDKPFVVGIDSPDNNGETLGSVELKDKSIVTSGTYQRYFTDSQGNIYHHILNPNTGYPENNDLKEVVVISDSSLEADILSTSLFLMGKDKAIDYLAKNKKQVDVILVTKENKIYISEDLKENFKLNEIYSDDYKIETIK